MAKMPSKFPYHITDNTLSAFVGGKLLQTDRDNPTFNRIVELLNDSETSEEVLVNALKPIGAVAEALNGVVNVRVYAGGVYVNDVQIHSSLATRVLDIAALGLDMEPWVRFVQNVYANPNPASQQEFFDWWEVAEMPLTPDGCFLAYKIVGSDYLDLYSHSYDNSVGNVVVFKGGREGVDDNRHNTCSVGLHFCSKGYLPQYGVGGGSRVLIVKINPADVVSFPTDSGLSKGRTWRYEVVGEISRELAGLKEWLPIDPTWDSPEDVEDVDVDDELFKDDEVDREGDFEGSEPFGGNAGCRQVVDEPVVKTQHYGDITPSGFQQMRANHGGSNRALARALGVPIGTIGGWVSSFRKKGVNV